MKASTWPPEYDDKLEQIRDRTVVEVVPSTVGRFCCGAYKKHTATFGPLLRSWPGWDGASKSGRFSVKGIFDSELKIGDAVVVLWKAPLEYEGKRVG